MWQCQTRNLLPMTSSERTMAVSPPSVVEWTVGRAWKIQRSVRSRVSTNRGVPFCQFPRRILQKPFFPSSFPSFLLFFTLFIYVLISFLLLGVCSFAGYFTQLTERVRYFSYITFIYLFQYFFQYLFIYLFCCALVKRLSFNPLLHYTSVSVICIYLLCLPLA